MISAQLFKNVVPLENFLQSHCNGKIYTFDYDLRPLGQQDGGIFSAEEIEPIFANNCYFALGSDQSMEHALFQLCETRDIKLLSVPAGASAFSFESELYVLHQQTLLRYNGGQLEKVRSFTDVHEIFCFGARLFYIHSTEIESDGREHRLPIRPLSRFVQYNNLLIDTECRQIIDLETFNFVKCELQPEAVLGSRVLCYHRAERPSRVEALKQYQNVEDRAERYRLVNESMQKRPQEAHFLQLKCEQLQDFSTVEGRHCRVPGGLAAGELIDIENGFSFRFAFDGLYYGETDYRLVSISADTRIQKIYEYHGEYYGVLNKQFVYRSNDYICIDQNMYALPSNSNGTLYCKHFILNGCVFLLAINSQIEIYKLDKQFELFQELQEIETFLQCYVFNEQLFILAKDENNTILYIYYLKNQQFEKADDIILESSDFLSYEFGLLIDLQNNKLIDLDSRVIYERKGVIQNYRREMYNFGVCCSDAYLKEFAGFNYDVWVLKMQRIKDRIK